MLKRLRWLAAGLAMGLGGSVWAQRKVKAVTDRYRPTAVVGNTADRARGLPKDVRAAVRDGRTAMREREAELRGYSQMPGKRTPGRP